MTSLSVNPAAKAGQFPHSKAELRLFVILLTALESVMYELVSLVNGLGKLILPALQKA